MQTSSDLKKIIEVHYGIAMISATAECYIELSSSSWIRWIIIEKLIWGLRNNGKCFRNFEIMCNNDYFVVHIKHSCILLGKLKTECIVLFLLKTWSSRDKDTCDETKELYSVLLLLVLVLIIYSISTHILKTSTFTRKLK